MQFQSTRPVWGATAACNSVELCGLISIHAPRVGRDSGHHLVRHHPGDFNPRAPCGARLVCLVLERRLHQHFNPRAPCGARPPSPDSIRSWQLFQSTRPVWGATGQRVFLRQRQQFQSTRPVWGATIHVAESVHRANISIHAPRVGRDLPPGILSWPGSISIHAPRVGRDLWKQTLGLGFGRFQSTRPVWGATANLTILPRQICTKGTKEFLLGRKTHGKKEK